MNPAERKAHINELAKIRQQKLRQKRKEEHKEHEAKQQPEEEAKQEPTLHELLLKIDRLEALCKNLQNQVNDLKEERREQRNAPPALPPFDEKYNDLSYYTIDKTDELLDELTHNSESTRNKYKKDMTTVFMIMKEPNLLFLKDFEKTKEKIENHKQKNGKTYTINSVKGYVQVIVFTIDKLLNHLIDDTLRRKYIKCFDVLKVKSSDVSQKTRHNTKNNIFRIRKKD